MAIAQSNGSTDVTDGGATGAYTVVLDSEPTDDVTITIDPDVQNDLGSCAGTSSPAREQNQQQERNRRRVRYGAE